MSTNNQPHLDTTADLPVGTSGNRPEDQRPSSAVANADVEAGGADDADDADDDDWDDDGPVAIGPSPWRQRIRGLGACFVSTAVHLIGLVVLSLCMVALPKQPEPQQIVSVPIEEVKDEELQEIELDPEMTPSTDMTSPISSSPMSGLSGALSGSLASAGELDAKAVQKMESVNNKMTIEHPIASIPTSKTLIDEVPEGAKGESRMIIDNYNQAFDVITQEIMWMLDRSDVLVVWCFDQSGSMKDDQKEIRDRVQKVYVELGLAKSKDYNKKLMTGVASYGAKFAVHTPKPTSDYQTIRQAIDAVPEDPSGSEVMCEAVGRFDSAFPTARSPPPNGIDLGDRRKRKHRQ